MRQVCLATMSTILWLTGITAIAGELSLPSQANVLDTLTPKHPRLLADADDFANLAHLCEVNPVAGRWQERMRAEAQRLIDTPPLEYAIPDGKRLLRVSRAVKDRVLMLSLMYRLTGEEPFANRVWIELDTVTRFEDWNPSHFLDTAEMTFAVAIGYDWLHDVWNEDQRRQLRDAIVRLGLSNGLDVYRHRRGWSRSIHNWNQVCNGGMGVGALAIADDVPDVASEVLHSALQSLPLAMSEFSPDGGWGEGPGYWRYATEYNVYFLAALQTALGRDFGLNQMPGFSATGDFPIHFNSPIGKTFNYADAKDGWRGAPQLFWLATAFEQPCYAAWQMPYAQDAPSPLDLVWGAAWLGRESNPDLRALPMARHFSGVSVVTMRSAWHDTSATFVGFKGGDNRVNHGQLDLGSFVLDADGVRWAIDLGPDDYNMPGYFGSQRWSYYRNRTEGHNTLVINGKNQSTTATAPISRFDKTDKGCTAVADLTEAYPDAKRVLRSITLKECDLTVQDVVIADQPVNLQWDLHTQVKVAVDGNRATMIQEGKTLAVEIVRPSSAKFHVVPVTIKPPQRPMQGVNRLSIALPEAVSKTELTVQLTRN